MSSIVPEISVDENLGIGAGRALPKRGCFCITSIEDMGYGSGPATHRQLFRLYQALAKQENLTARISLRWPLAQWATIGLGLASNPASAMIGSASWFEGICRRPRWSNTAKMYEPYLNEPYDGDFITPLNKLCQYAMGSG